MLGENYRLKEKINRIIEHAEETIGELQVEIDQTKKYYVEREEKMQSMIEGLEKELARCQHTVSVLSHDLDHERMKVTKASHYIEMQGKVGWDAKVNHELSLGSSTGTGVSQHLALSELGADGRSSSSKRAGHLSETSSPSTTPLKVRPSSPLRIDVSEFAPASPDTSIFRASVTSPGRASASGEGGSLGSPKEFKQLRKSVSSLQAEVDRLSAELETSRRETASMAGIMESLNGSDEVLAKYDANRSKEKQLLRSIKASTPMKKAQLVKCKAGSGSGLSSSSRASSSSHSEQSGRDEEDDGGGITLHAVHHAQHVRFGKSKGLKLLPRDLEARVNTKAAQKQKRLEIAANGIHSARSKTDGGGGTGRSKGGQGRRGVSSSSSSSSSYSGSGTSAGSSSATPLVDPHGHYGEELDADDAADLSDTEMQETRQAIFGAVRSDLNAVWHDTSGSARPLGEVLATLQKRLSMTITSLREREEEAREAKEGVSALIEERSGEIKLRMVELEAQMAAVRESEQSYRSKLGHSEDEAHRLGKQVSDLQHEQERLQTRLENAKGHETKQSQEIAHLNDRYHRLEQEMEDQRREREKELASLQTELKHEQSRALTAEQGHASATQTKVNKVAAEAKEREQELVKHHKEDTRRLEKRVKGFQEDIVSLKAEIRSAEEEHHKAMRKMVPRTEHQEQLEAAHQESDSLHAEVDRLSKKVNNLHNDLKGCHGREADLSHELQALQDSPAVREYDGICAKNEFLRKEVKELGDALNAAEAAVEELEAQEKHLTGELHLAQKQGQVHEAELSEMGEALEASEGEKEALKESLRLEEEACNDLADKLRAITEDAEALERHVSKGEGELGALQEEHEALSEAHRDLEEALSKEKHRSRELAERVDRTDRSLQGAVADMSTKTKQLAQSTEEVQQLSETCKRLQESVDGSAGELDRHKKAAEGDMRRLEGLNLELEAKLATALDSERTLTEQLRDAHDETKRHRELSSQKYDDMCASLDELADRCTAGKEREEALDRERIAAQAEAREVEKGHSKLLALYEAKCTECESLAEGMEETKKDVARREDDTQTLVRDLGDAGATITKLRAEVGTLSGALFDAKASLEASEEKRTDHARDLASEKERVQQAHAQVIALEGEQDALTAAVAESHAKSSELRTSLDERAALLEDTERHLSALKEDYAALEKRSESQILRQTSRITELSDQNEHLRLHNDELSDERKSASEQHAEALRAVQARNKAKLAELAGEAERERAAAADTLAALKEEHARMLSREVGRLQESLDGRDQALEQVQGDLETAQMQAVELRAHHEATVSSQKEALMRGHAAEVSEMRRVHEEKEQDLQAHVEVLEANKEALQKALQTHKAKSHAAVTQLKAEVTTLQEEAKTAGEASEHAKEERDKATSDLQDEVRRGKDRLKAKDKTIEYLREQVHELAAKGEEASGEVVERREEVARLKNDFVRVQKDLGTAKQEASKHSIDAYQIRTELESVRTEKEGMWRKLETVTKDAKSASLYVGELTQKAEGLEREICDLRVDRDTLKGTSKDLQAQKDSLARALDEVTARLASMKASAEDQISSHSEAMQAVTQAKDEALGREFELTGRLAALERSLARLRAESAQEVEMLTQHQHAMLEAHASELDRVKESHRVQLESERKQADAASKQQKEAQSRQIESLNAALEEGKNSFAATVAQMERARDEEKERSTRRAAESATASEQKLAYEQTLHQALSEEVTQLRADNEAVRADLLQQKQAASEIAIKTRREADDLYRQLQVVKESYLDCERKRVSAEEEAKRVIARLDKHKADAAVELSETRKTVSQLEQTAAHLKEDNQHLRREVQRFEEETSQSKTSFEAMVKRADDARDMSPRERDLQEKLDGHRDLQKKTMDRLKAAQEDANRAAEHKAQAEALQGRAEEAEAGLARYDEERRLHSLRVKELEEEVKRARADGRATELREEAGVLKMHEMEATQRQLSRSCAESEQRAARATGEWADLKALLEEAQRAHREEVDALVAARDAELDSLSHQLVQNEGVRRGLVDQLQAQEAAHSEVEAAKNTAIADLNARLVSLEEEHDEKASQLSEAKQTIQDKDRHVKLATSEVSQLSRALEDKVGDLEAQVRSAREGRQREEKKKEAAIAELQAEVASMEERERALQRKYDHSLGLFEQSENKLATAEAERKGLVTRAVEASKTSKGLEASLAEARAQLEGEGEARRTTEAECARLTKLLHLKSLERDSDSVWGASSPASSSISASFSAASPAGHGASPVGIINPPLASSDAGLAVVRQMADERDSLQDRLQASEAEHHATAKLLATTSRTLRLLQEDVLVCGYEDVVGMVARESSVDIQKFRRKRRRVPQLSGRGARNIADVGGDDEGTSSRASSDGYSDSESSLDVGRASYPGETAQALLSEEAIADNGTSVSPVARTDSPSRDKHGSSTAHPAPGDDSFDHSEVSIQPATIRASRYGANSPDARDGFSPMSPLSAAKGTAGGPITELTPRNSELGVDLTPETSGAGGSHAVTEEALTVQRKGKEGQGKNTLSSLKKARQVGRALDFRDAKAKNNNEKGESAKRSNMAVGEADSDDDANPAWGRRDSDDSDISVKSSLTGGGYGSDDDDEQSPYEATFQALDSSKKPKKGPRGNGDDDDATVGMQSGDDSSGEDTDVEHHASSVPKVLREELSMLMQRLDSSSAVRYKLLRSQHRMLVQLGQELGRLGAERGRLAALLEEERRRVASLTQHQARLTEMVVSGYNNSGPNPELGPGGVDALDLDDTMEEYSPDSPAARQGKQEASAVTTQDADDRDSSVVFFADMDGGSPPHDPRAQSADRLASLLQQSRANNRENQSAALSVVRAAKEETRAVKAEMASLEGRLRATMRAYAALQHACLEQDHHHNEAAKSLVHTMEENRNQSHAKVETLTAKVRELSLSLKERGQGR